MKLKKHIYKKGCWLQSGTESSRLLPAFCLLSLLPVTARSESWQGVAIGDLPIVAVDTGFWAGQPTLFIGTQKHVYRISARREALLSQSATEESSWTVARRPVLVETIRAGRLRGLYAHPRAEGVAWVGTASFGAVNPAASWQRKGAIPAQNKAALGRLELNDEAEILYRTPGYINLLGRKGSAQSFVSSAGSDWPMFPIAQWEHRCRSLQTVCRGSVLAALPDRLYTARGVWRWNDNGKPISSGVELRPAAGYFSVITAAVDQAIQSAIVDIPVFRNAGGFAWSAGMIPAPPQKSTETTSFRSDSELPVGELQGSGGDLIWNYAGVHPLAMPRRGELAGSIVVWNLNSLYLHPLRMTLPDTRTGCQLGLSPQWVNQLVSAVRRYFQLHSAVQEESMSRAIRRRAWLPDLTVQGAVDGGWSEGKDEDPLTGISSTERVIVLGPQVRSSSWDRDQNWKISASMRWQLERLVYDPAESLYRQRRLDEFADARSWLEQLFADIAVLQSNEFACNAPARIQAEIELRAAATLLLQPTGELWAEERQ